MKIVVDAMGGDNAPHSTVRGAMQAVKEYGVDVVLVGRGEDNLVTGDTCGAGCLFIDAGGCGSQFEQFDYCGTL